MASTVVAAGLTTAAAGFAGRYALQAMKPMEPQVKQVFQSLPKSAFSGGYYRVLKALCITKFPDVSDDHSKCSSNSTKAKSTARP
ncbi:hypothetical protein J1605_009719 [Eschrichtius robustus]|uniref:Mitochondrial import inner membrane translocase subunit TIM14 n=1 Tax=Eschrichtius robustus TaxID=9764 RepID=A0AB34GWH4_ESCRO|nr:hypothetical protein J1605_009719 [Eschrichtius robustus]